MELSLLTPLVLSGLIVLTFILAFMIWRKLPPAIAPQLEMLAYKIAKNVDLTIRSENAQDRTENATNSKHLREEVTNSMSRLSDSTLSRISDLVSAQRGQFETFAKQIDILMDKIEQMLEGKKSALQAEREKIRRQKRRRSRRAKQRMLEQKCHQSEKKAMRQKIVDRDS